MHNGDSGQKYPLVSRSRRRFHRPGGPAAELHTPSVGFRRGWLAEQLAPPAGLCGLALTAADLAAGPLPTPSEDYGSAPRASGLAVEIQTPPAGFRGGRIASTPSENCGYAPRASGLEAEILLPPDTTGHPRTPPDWLQTRPANKTASSAGGSLWTRAGWLQTRQAS
ncbi:hypothetical protein NQZ68_025138 [Dissostichus eleginoides]|nr:hypothetical protein NQZ68_025138 [Dissostichus eleginoides]